MVERARPVISESAPSRRPDLPGREHPPTAFIKLRADGLPTFANRVAINHADPPHITTSQRQESRRPEFTSPHAV